MPGDIVALSQHKSKERILGTVCAVSEDGFFFGFFRTMEATGNSSTTRTCTRQR
ncbi:hypothetical protein J3D46_004916 [Paenarthrobacter sp. A20]|nr:hypothetical protein [Paenarthrobacter sp. A20]